jgi:methionyl-tRNA formyltransferase
MNPIRIIFMGTSDFAVPSLQILLEAGYQVVALVTVPDKPQGRGGSILPSPTKIFAHTQGIPVLQPENLKDAAFLATLEKYDAHLYVVVAFRMLPTVVWQKPSLGTINLHASLLPDYRGAAPINWAIIQGEKKTGLTTFFIDASLDTGKILLQTDEPVYTVDTVGTLSERLKYKGAKLLLKSIKAVENGDAIATPQLASSDTVRSKAPKIYKQDCQINWYQSTEAVYNFIRGLSPSPGAYTTLKDIQVKILTAYPLALGTMEPGCLYSDGKSYLYIGTEDGVLAIEELQPAGRKIMDIRSFLQGYKLFRGE